MSRELEPVKGGSAERMKTREDTDKVIQSERESLEKVGQIERQHFELKLNWLNMN